MYSGKLQLCHEQERLHDTPHECPLQHTKPCLPGELVLKLFLSLLLIQISGEVKRCSFPNCNYTTPKTGHMTQHINCHLNIRNHICQVGK